MARKKPMRFFIPMDLPQKEEIESKDKKNFRSLFPI